jgi:hypothetical protein
MDVLSLFLMNEKNRLNSSQKNHNSKSFLLWRKELEEQKNYETKERTRSLSYKQEDTRLDRQDAQAERL